MKPSKYNESLLTAEYIRTQLLYDYETGEFHWIFKGMGRKRDKQAGTVKGTTGYRRIGITINGKCRLFLAHRLAWLYVYGVWPKAQIDHIDRNRSNNRIANLREATYMENNRSFTKRCNCSSEFIGVNWCKRQKKWVARIRVNKNRKFIGLFASEEQAAIAYNKAALARDSAFHNLNKIIT